MGLVVSLLFWGFQEPVVTTTPDLSRTTAIEPVKVEETRPLVVPPTAPSRKLTERAEANGPSLGAFLFWSCAVIALLVGSFLLFKRFTRHSRLFRSSSIIDVLARKGLGPKQEITLVEIGGKVLILGSTRDRISTLGEITDPGAVAQLKSKVTGEKEGAVTRLFHESLKSGLREYEKEPDPMARTRGNGILDELASLKKTVNAWRA
jgi:flagellar biogenesis protein FliO